jgi:hypothetical protein
MEIDHARIGVVASFGQADAGDHDLAGAEAGAGVENAAQLGKHHDARAEQGRGEGYLRG